MSLSDATLSDLVAELRARLRRLAAVPPGRCAPDRTPGPLDRGERVALAARVLAGALRQRRGPDAAEAAAAFGGLAESVDLLPEPLAASHLDADLDALVQALEDLAHAWDRAADDDPAWHWPRVRAAGDAVWGTAGGVPGPAPRADADAGSLREVWLLIAGDLRRASLTRRLTQAGITVVTLARPEDALTAARERRPDAVICDDAAPHRHFRRLLATLPPGGLPVVRVQGRDAMVPVDAPTWTPPFRVEDLEAALSR